MHTYIKTLFNKKKSKSKSKKQLYMKSGKTKRNNKKKPTR